MDAIISAPSWPQFGLQNIVQILCEGGRGEVKSAEEECGDALHSVFHGVPSNVFALKYELTFY